LKIEYMSNHSNFQDILRTLFLGSGVLFIGHVLEAGIGFGARLLMARFLGPINYGGVAIGITLLNILSTLSLVGLDTGVGRYLPRYNANSDKLGVLLSSLLIAVPFSIFVGGTISFVAPHLANDVFGGSVEVETLQVFGIAVPIVVVLDLVIGSIQGTEIATPKVYIKNITLPVLRFSFIVVSILLGLGSLGVAWAYFLSYLISVFMGIVFLTKFFDYPGYMIPDLKLQKLFRFSLPLMVTASTVTLLSNIDTVMIGHYSNSTAVGIYNVIYPLAQLMTFVISSFGFLGMPLLSRLHNQNRDDDIENLYRIVTKWQVVFTLPLFMSLIYIPDEVIALTFGEEYIAGETALSIIALALFSHSVSGPNKNLLTAAGKTRLIMFDNVLVSSLNIILNFLLVPRFGFVGAAIATMLSYSLLNIIYTIQIFMYMDIHPIPRLVFRTTFLSFVFCYIITSYTRKLSDTIEVLSFIMTTMVVVLVITWCFDVGNEERQILSKLNVASTLRTLLGDSD